MKEQLNLGVVRLVDGTLDCSVYDYPHKAFCRDFCDEHEQALTGDVVLWALPLRVQGRTYRERQEFLRDLALDAQQAITYSGDDAAGGFGADSECLSMGELADIQSWFEQQGRRYGLLREFQINAIC